MTPDLYGAWLTAGNNLQPIGAWLARSCPNLAAAVALGAFAWWSIRRCLRDANHRIDAILAEVDDQPDRETQPGTDVRLYLDCVAIYGDSDELDRLRDAINQHRTGDTNG